MRWLVEAASRHRLAMVVSPLSLSSAKGCGVRRLSGWDAMLLYSETPNVYKHTMKIGIIDVADFEGEFSFDFFRAEFKRRLYLLEPLRLKLVDTPMKLHH